MDKLFQSADFLYAKENSDMQFQKAYWTIELALHISKKQSVHGDYGMVIGELVQRRIQNTRWDSFDDCSILESLKRSSIAATLIDHSGSFEGIEALDVFRVALHTNASSSTPKLLSTTGAILTSNTFLLPLIVREHYRRTKFLKRHEILFPRKKMNYSLLFVTVLALFCSPGIAQYSYYYGYSPYYWYPGYGYGYGYGYRRGQVARGALAGAAIGGLVGALAGK
ncbi:hypothetical protein RB195_014719 [Necator americanus]|uniref:Uncharacterized protein n=1 Tax=Necator americanus TaxID=51031 RepID=A0ABR1E1B1_NECAM